MKAQISSDNLSYYWPISWWLFYQNKYCVFNFIFSIFVHFRWVFVRWVLLLYQSYMIEVWFPTCFSIGYVWFRLDLSCSFSCFIPRYLLVRCRIFLFMLKYISQLDNIPITIIFLTSSHFSVFIYLPARFSTWHFFQIIRLKT